jgi:hypothetical protein
MIDVEFMSDQDETPSDLPHLDVGLTNQEDSRMVARVIVRQAGDPLRVINVWANCKTYFFKQSVLLWGAYIVIGIGHQITLVQLEDHTSITTDLEGYFGYLYPVDNFLLVASESYLHCFGDDGQLLWISKPLGIDGVIVEEVKGGIVFGLGEWDPPGGWQPFRLNLMTGESS